MNIEITDEYKKVLECIDNKITPVYVSGKAGVGKSTLIKHIKNTYKNVVITAPTGIAALNVNGATIHSFFNIPPRYITIHEKRNLQPKDVIYATEILIIDEISMVNANLLDTIEYVLRLSKRNKLPFGGIPVIMFGDLYQLPPVVTDETRKLFEREYETPFFFSANCLKKTPLTTIELTKVFRQKDETFVKILNNIRTGHDIENTIQLINSNVEITTKYDKNSIVLTTTNDKCTKINNYELNKIDGDENMYFGKIDGNFPLSSLPCDSMIDLKVGAKVMCVKNLENAVNGTIGTVVYMNDKTVNIRTLDGSGVTLNYVTWENHGYTVKKGEISVVVKGTYTQIPLKLAWALTIHKSQSQTLDKVHIDMDKGAFASGQLYVALSRCTSLEGISLSRPLYTTDIIVNKDVINFYEKVI